MQICKIVEKKYLKNGAKYWPGSIEEAQVILYNGSSETNIVELFESYEIGEDLLPLLKTWSYDEIICSALSYCYHFQVITNLDWTRLLAFLLFPYNKTTSSFVLSFLKKNSFSIELSQKEILTGATGLLIEVPPSSIRLNNLLYFLRFLQISETDTNFLLEESRKAKNYLPVLLYLQNRDRLFLDTDLDLKERIKIREETLFDTDRRESPESLVTLFGTLVFGFLLFLITIKRFAGVRDGKPFFVGTTPIGFVMPSASTDIETSSDVSTFASTSTGPFVSPNVETSSDVSTFASTSTGPFVSPNVENTPNDCTLRRIGNQIVPGQPVLAGTSKNLVGVTSLEVQERKLSLEEVQSNTSKEDIGNMLKNELEKPKGRLVKEGVTKNIGYQFAKKKAEGFQITLDPNNNHITISMSNIQYSDFKHDFGVFKGRLSFINNVLQDIGNPHIFTYKQTILVNGQTFEMGSMTLDHPEGSRALQATGRTREEAVGTTKPQVIHDMHTKTRKTVERQNLFRANINDENVITSWTFLGSNTTFLSKGDNIDTYFRLRIETAIKSYDLVPDNFFTPTETREQYQKAEIQALKIAQQDLMEKSFNRRMSSKQILADMKMHSVFYQTQGDTKRFTSDLKNSIYRCAQSGSNEIILPNLVKKYASRVVNHNVESRAVIRVIRELFGQAGDPNYGSTLIGRCNNLLVSQSEDMYELNNILVGMGVNITPNSFDIFNSHTPGQESLTVLSFEKAVTEMDLDELDQRTGQLGSDIYDQSRINTSFKLPSNYTLTKKVSGSLSGSSFTSEIGSVSTVLDYQDGEPFLDSQNAINSRFGYIGGEPYLGPQNAVDPDNPGFI